MLSGYIWGYNMNEYRFMLPYLKPYAGKYALGLFFLILVDACQIFIPQIIKRAVDLIVQLQAKTATNVNITVYVLTAQIIGIALLISVGRFFWRYFIHGSSRKIEAQLRKDFFSHLLDLSHNFYQKNTIGDLIARSTNDINAVREAIGMGFVALVDGTFMAIAIIAAMFVQDWRTATFSVIPLPVITVLILVFGNAVGKKFAKVQQAYSDMSAVVQETFSGIRVVKSFVKENWFVKKFADTNDSYREANRELTTIFGAFFPLISLCSGLTTLVLIGIGGSRVIQGMMSAGEFASFFSYLQMLVWPIMSIGFMVNIMQRGAVGIKRIREILSEKPLITSVESPTEKSGEIPDEDSATFPASLSADDELLSVKNLSFDYAQDTQLGNDAQASSSSAPAAFSAGASNTANAEIPAITGANIENISFSLKKGEILGILGKTGCGKSTLLKSLVRLIDTPAGTVFIHGTDITTVPLGQLRSVFAVVPQDTYLFSDSIKNNIGYADDDLCEEFLAQAADISAISNDFAALENGRETLIGERGIALSGGQKQRTAVARAVYKALKHKSCEIIVFDGSFSALDSETEKQVTSSIFSQFGGSGDSDSGNSMEENAKTIIIVSHRVSALQNADKIIVMQDGKIAEAGTPQELERNKRSIFAETARMQSLEKVE
ncbi:MAG: lipid A export permease/ATP-binding protein MsbA [Treponemataceae bacterium]|nr:MAG: lipid A export permease/ATP-binding protein MsbA [Treponemataceae bacterium]